MPMLPKVPPASSSPMFVPPLREGESGVAKTEPTLPKRHRRPATSTRVACVEECRRVNSREDSPTTAPPSEVSSPYICPPVRPVDSTGKLTKATLPTWRAAQLVRHDRFFLRPTSQLPQEIIHGDSAKIAHRADFSSAPVCVLVSGHGDSAKATTPLNWFANVAFRERRFSPSCAGKSAGENAMPMLPKCPPRAMSSPMFVFPSRRGRLRQSNNGADCFETASLPNFFAALGLRPV